MTNHWVFIALSYVVFVTFLLLDQISIYRQSRTVKQHIAARWQRLQTKQQRQQI